MPVTATNDAMRLDDLISQITTGAIQINRTYQRSGQIWPARAKSFLVETVLLGMPIPRVLLHDIGPAQSTQQREIIDGQQRCTILTEFRSGGFALTSAVDDANNLQGKRFGDLTSRQQAAFNSYSVLIDRYTGLSPRQIRLVFRRLNYYTAPLNAAEQRHAQFFGELSRFVEAQSAAWASTFDRMRVFTQRQRRRRADEQLMAEVVDAILNGLSTPTAKSLRDVYQRYEVQFSSAGDFRRRLENARATLAGWAGLRRNRLMRKHYQVFSLLLALMHAQGDLAALRGDLGSQRQLRREDRILTSLERLADAVARRVTRGRYARFCAASEEKTNVRDNRLTRCRYFYGALTGRDMD